MLQPVKEKIFQFKMGQMIEIDNMNFKIKEMYAHLNRELLKHLVDKTIVLETYPSHLDRKVNPKSDIRKRVIKKIIAEQKKKKESNRRFFISHI
jgi:hypothetical protein